jgi:hypothetical protein
MVGARTHYSDHYYGRDCLHNHSGKNDLEFETSAAVYRRIYCCRYLGMTVDQNHRAP